MKYLLNIFFTLVVSTSFAQTDSLEITTTINNLFNGMKNRDSALVASCFHPDVKMETVFINKEGNTILHTGKLDEFVKAVGSDHEGEWIEKLTSITLHSDKIMASAWTRYEFYVDENFIHCGVNSFQLVKLDNKWVITYLIDTRRKQGCKE